MSRDLQRRVHALVDGWWDAEQQLLTAPSGRHGRSHGVRGERGLLAPTLWWAHGLLRRGAPADRRLAQQAVRGVLERQPDPSADVGAMLGLLALDHRAAFPGELGERLQAATARAAWSAAEDALPVGDTAEVALRAWLDLHVGARDGDEALLDRGTELAEELSADTRSRGAVATRASPTATGGTLLGLSLWAERPPVPWLAASGAELRDRVWRDLLLAWHPRLRVLSPPLTHAFGLDPREHVGAAMPWLAWLLRNTPALPPLDGGTLHQGHDLPIALLVPSLAGAGDDVRALAEDLGPAPLRRGAWSETFGNRTWTGWSGRTLVAGAERGPVDARGDWRQVGAAMVFEGPGIGTCWVRLLADRGPVVADVSVEGDAVVLRHPVVPGTRVRLLVGGTQGDDEVEADATRVTVARRVVQLRGVTSLRPVPPTSVPDATWEAELDLAGELVELTTPAG